MFSDDDIKDMPGSHLLQPGDEIISIREVCLTDKSDKRDLGFHNEPLLPSSSRNDDVTRSLFRDGFFPDGLEPQQARFAWTEEDGNIAAFVSESGFGTAPILGKDLDVGELKEADTSTPPFPNTVMSRNGLMFTRKPAVDSQVVSSTSSLNERGKTPCKVDKTDPRSRYHYVKYVKRHGRNVKLWECGICGREFQHQYTLMRHLPTHTDERNFHCSECGKSFRQLSTLSQHRAIHSAERPYSCEVCKKTFNRVSTLISHRKTHSDEKPYRCHICPKGFHQKGNLRNHLFTHTNERPYRCSICMKGFNQQSNLVCHKNKAHLEDGCVNVVKRRSAPRLPRPAPEQPDSTRQPPPEQCEVSSSVGPYLPAIEGPSTSNWIPAPPSQTIPWNLPKLSPAPDIWTNDVSWGSGVIVDPIKTYPMSVALATKQTPFALLKADNNSPPVLVKVVDTNLPGGKQMLVPATAEDLRVGGKIVVKNEDGTPNEGEEAMAGAELGGVGAGAGAGAVQIRVPVVATVVPRMKPGGRLQLVVEEPHHVYHTALSSDVMPLEACSSSHQHVPPPPPPLQRRDPCTGYADDALPSGNTIRGRISSTCTLPPPAPSPPALSPPLDLIPMDLFEPMECIPMGPQITAVDHIDRPPHSDDSEIFIGEFEEDLPLSDSE